MATKSRTKKAASKKAAPKKTTERKPGNVDAEKQPAQPKPPVTDAPAQRDDSGEICVFAFRLTRSERDEIHAASGSAKASSFVRGLALAAARGDLKAVERIVDAVHK